jgi:hypothetical protein
VIRTEEATRSEAVLRSIMVGLGDCKGSFTGVFGMQQPHQPLLTPVITAISVIEAAVNSSSHDIGVIGE